MVNPVILGKGMPLLDGRNVQRLSLLSSSTILSGNVLRAPKDAMQPRCESPLPPTVLRMPQATPDCLADYHPQERRGGAFDRKLRKLLRALGLVVGIGLFIPWTVNGFQDVVDFLLLVGGIIIVFVVICYILPHRPETRRGITRKNSQSSPWSH